MLGRMDKAILAAIILEDDDINAAVGNEFAEVLGDTLGQMAGRHKMRKEDHAAMVNEFAEFAKKWFDLETYPAKDENEDEEMPEEMKPMMAILARSLNMLHSVGITTSALVFAQAPPALYRSYGSLFQKCSLHAYEVGLREAKRAMREAKQAAQQESREKKAEERSQREAKARQAHPAAAQAEASQPPAQPDEDANKN